MVLEAHVGRRAQEAVPVLAPVIAGLRREGVLVDAGATEGCAVAVAAGGVAS